MRAQGDTFAILGCGKVGTAIGFLLRARGYSVVAVASRSEESLMRGVEYTGAHPYHTFPEAARQARYVVISTSDDAIATVCDAIAETGAIGAGSTVIHLSGASGLDLLASARRSGASVASIHPIQSFSDIQSAIATLPGSTFGITADKKIEHWAFDLVQNLGGVPFSVSENDKPLYHAAACMASNYLVTLMNTVVDVYRTVGLTDEDATQAFWPLVKGTMLNIEGQGTVQSLTGPISRGDVETIKKHLAAFTSRLPHLLPLYREMGFLAVEVGLQKSTLPRERAEQIKSLLSGGIHDEQSGQNE